MRFVFCVVSVAMAFILLTAPCSGQPPKPSDAPAKEKEADPKPFVYNAEKDPLAWFLTSAELQKLSETLANAQQAVYFIGSPERGIVGTAFCISKKHRLLVTCASVIDDQFGRHKLTLMDAMGREIPMQRFWFHPDLLRTSPDGKPVHPDQAPKGEVFQGSPDVSLIQLKEDAPAPRRELTLLPPDQGSMLRGHAVGVPNFSKFTHPWWPRETDIVFNSFRSFGYVCSVEKLQTAGTDASTRPWHLLLTAATWEGASGAPAILEDGTVVGIVNGSGIREPAEKPRIVSSAIPVDAVWDLLNVVKRQDNVPIPTPINMRGPKASFDRAGVHFPPSFAEMQKACAEAKGLLKEKKFAAAARALSPLCEPHGIWWDPFLLRANVWTGYVNHAHEVKQPLSREEEQKYTRWFLEDALSALQRNPTEPQQHINVGYALCWMAQATKEEAYARAVLVHCTRRIEALPKEKLRAQYLALRA